MLKIETALSSLCIGLWKSFPNSVRQVGGGGYQIFVGTKLQCSRINAPCGVPN